MWTEGTRFQQNFKILLSQQNALLWTIKYYSYVQLSKTVTRPTISFHKINPLKMEKLLELNTL